MISIESQERPWGRYFVLHDEPTYKLKRIEVDPGGRLSYQYHHKRSEAWTIVEGVGTITLDDITINSGATLTVEKEASLTLTGNYTNNAVVYSINTDSNEFASINKSSHEIYCFCFKIDL